MVAPGEPNDRCVNCKAECRYPERWTHCVEEAGTCNFCGCRDFKETDA